METLAKLLFLCYNENIKVRKNEQKKYRIVRKSEQVKLIKVRKNEQERVSRK